MKTLQVWQPGFDRCHVDWRYTVTQMYLKRY